MLTGDDIVVHQYIINNICIYGIDKSHAVCISQKKIYPTREVKVWGVCKEGSVASPISVLQLCLQAFCYRNLAYSWETSWRAFLLGAIFGSFD